MSKQAFGDILSHAEVQQLLIRNNHQPDLGKPEYVCWSNNKLRPISQADLDIANQAANLGPELSMVQWEAKLNSKRWRINHGKEHRTVTRPTRVRSGENWTWSEVELNARIK